MDKEKRKQRCLDSNDSITHSKFMYVTVHDKDNSLRFVETLNDKRDCRLLCCV